MKRIMISFGIMLLFLSGCGGENVVSESTNNNSNGWPNFAGVDGDLKIDWAKFVKENVEYKPAFSQAIYSLEAQLLMNPAELEDQILLVTQGDAELDENNCYTVVAAIVNKTDKSIKNVKTKLFLFKDGLDIAGTELLLSEEQFGVIAPNSVYLFFAVIPVTSEEVMDKVLIDYQPGYEIIDYEVVSE